MEGEIACSNCGIDFGNDVGAVGRKCPACGNGGIRRMEEDDD